MKSMQDRNDSSGALWFVAGVAIGATVGILFAPHSGQETRRRIGSKAREGRDRLQDQGRVLMDRGRELYDRGRQIADEAAELFEEGRRIVQD
jgi:gas vesicle protein